MANKRRVTSRKTAAVALVVIVLVATGAYVLWAHEAGQPLFGVSSSCSGYPPEGNCPGSYSYAFRISVNYTGPWRATYYGYHGVEAAASTPDHGSGNYTGGMFGGTGYGEKTVTLSEPNTNFLTLCVQAEKLDSSSAVMTLGIEGGSNSTSLPYGETNLCLGVVP